MDLNMQLTDNEIDIIKRYEDRLRTAVFQDYSRGVISSDLERLRLIYNKVKGIDYNLNKTCASCQLTFLKLLGRWWFAYKEEVLDKEPDKVSEALEPVLKINDLQKPVTNTNKSTSITTNKGQKKQPRKNGKKDNITE